MALVTRVQRNRVAIVESQLAARPRSLGDGPTLRLTPFARDLAAERLLVAPGVPCCLRCGFGPRGPRHIARIRSL